jgi:subtilisin family serine protease
LLQNDTDVAGVYPVRAAFPASVSERLVANAQLARPSALLPGFGGRGVTIALLDTGVDLTHPYLHGHVQPGLDLVSAGDDASAGADPLDPAQLERHGTEPRRELVGRGPGGCTASRPTRPSSRFASPAGSRTRPGPRRCMRGATS